MNIYLDPRPQIDTE